MGRESSYLMAAKGKVYLVGAGPGDPGLITVKGAQILKECDAVVYDRLVPLELVVALPPGIERHYVGKSSGQYSLPQNDINSLLERLAGKGLTVVRLKGGDPFIFGRGGEEAYYLKQKGIPYEVIPGVTAGIAAPAYAGIPLTHRGRSVLTIFLTAHEAIDKDEPQVPWEWLGKASNGSIVGYMGVKQLPQTVDNLIRAGMPPETPAALIQRGTTGVQKTATGTLRELPALAERETIRPPALFIIGETVELAGDLAWFGAGILSSKRIWVTRPADQAAEMYHLLRVHGAEVLPLPTIATTNHILPIDEQCWTDLITVLNTSREAAGEGIHRWLVFTSENGVRYFLRQLLDRGYDLRSIGDFSIAAVGSGTGMALSRQGLKADFIPSRATTAALVEELSQRIRGQQNFVLRIRGNMGDDSVEGALRSAGAEVIPLQVYSTATAEWDAGMWAHLDDNPPDVITFTSGSTVTGFIQILSADRARETAADAVVASIGPMTTRIAREAGIEVTIEADEHSIQGLVEAAVKHFSPK